MAQPNRAGTRLLAVSLLTWALVGIAASPAGAQTDNPFTVAAAVRMAAPPAYLNVIQSGGGTVTVTAPGRAPVTCDVNQSLYSSDPCEFFTLAQGETVTLTAEKDDNDPTRTFVGWSDRRCPAGPTPTCVLTLIDEQSVVARFTPAKVRVGFTGRDEATDTVTITDPSGHVCVAVPEDFEKPCGPYPLGTTLVLEAKGATPRWYPAHCDVLLSSPDESSAKCGLILRGDQRVNVAFGAEEPFDGIPQRQKVVFRVHKKGNGHVRGSVDCGSDCSAKVQIGDKVKLVAQPAAGSRFVRWIDGCKQPTTTCVIPATDADVTAEFAAVGNAGGSAKTFTATVGKARYSRQGKRRYVTVPITVSAPASARAKLTKGGKQVATKHVSSVGSSLRLRVPSSAKQGAYLLKLTIRPSAGGESIPVTRKVRVRT